MHSKPEYFMYAKKIFWTLREEYFMHVHPCAYVCRALLCSKTVVNSHTDKQVNIQVFWVYYAEQEGYWCDAALKKKDFKTAQHNLTASSFSPLQICQKFPQCNVNWASLQSRRLIVKCCVVNRSWKFLILLHHCLKCSTLLKAMKQIWCDLLTGLK
jgi:hypothetical protein